MRTRLINVSPLHTCHRPRRRTRPRSRCLAPITAARITKAPGCPTCPPRIIP